MRWLILLVALLVWPTSSWAVVSVTSLTSGMVAGSGEITSNSFTPTAGDTVVVGLAIPNNISYTIATTGYTWTCSTQYFTSNAIKFCWAFSVPSGAKTFATTGLNFNAIDYQVFDVSGLAGTQDQTGTQATPNSGSIAQVTSAGNLAASNELIMVLWSGTANPSPTLMSGYSSFGALGSNPNSGTLWFDVAYNTSGGTSGSTTTGGWTSLTASNGGAQMETFQASAGGGGGTTNGFFGPGLP